MLEAQQLKENEVNSTNTGGPAFPLEHSRTSSLHDGMTLRDYFAAKAMQGHIVASMSALATHYKTNPDAVSPLIAAAAYEMADAMLKAREQ